ncbi:low molecular weight protein-tyrosine-phosphatase [Pseudidiomarina mangrovi]|uniref:low molecular weight protein-tyrosine-phosphatase n=1 Tax=Pseudidiomarina mangrovi TaxID=2487133 RepID=UPI000FCAE96C|nr:low molecular weight protein-tyrosine-phosphatase [Pseudidiomarina mangrovi]
MFDKILVVCLGNICRSPTGEFALKRLLPDKHIASAGLQAMKHSDGNGWDMDKAARAVAERNGLVCPTHQAQQLSRELIGQYDLILVMEHQQRSHISQRYPEATAKTMLLGHWLQANGKEIPDPYKKSDDVYQHVFELIDQACSAWAKKLS